MSEEEKLKAFKEKLDQHYEWPSLYMFKFIVPKGKEAEVAKLFPNNEVVSKESKQGKYISLTFKVMMPGSDAIIQTYQKAQHIDGIISL